MSRPTRRELLLAGAALVACQGEPPEPKPADPLEPQPTGAEPRNVVLILTDDQRWDGFSFMAHPFLKTPVLDSIAATGAWCAEAFVTTSLCCPSRASMLSGLYAHSHGVLDNQTELDPRTVTYPRILERAGYDTAHIGKWHMGAKNPHPRPGWKRWIGFRGQGRYAYPGPDELDELDRGFSYDGEMKRARGYITDLLTDEAIAYLESRDGKTPFCMVVSHKACHAPFQPAPRHAEHFADAPVPEVLPDTDEAYAGLPPYLRRMRHHTVFGVEKPYGQWPDFASWYRDYHRTLLAVDESVGRILATLESTGLRERTVVMFTSDNGFMHGEKGVLDKRNAYEPSIRIPLLAHAPGLVSGGRRIDRMVLNVDLAPTILDVMGLTAPDTWHGRSILPLLRGDNVKKWRQDFLYEYFHERMFPSTPTVIGVRTASHKLVTHHGVDTPDELYDLGADPAETNDVVKDPAYADRRRGLMRRLRRNAGELGLLINPVWGRDWIDPARTRPSE